MRHSQPRKSRKRPSVRWAFELFPAKDDDRQWYVLTERTDRWGPRRIMNAGDRHLWMHPEAPVFILEKGGFFGTCYNQMAVIAGYLDKVDEGERTGALVVITEQEAVAVSKLRDTELFETAFSMQSAPHRFRRAQQVFPHLFK